MQDDYYQNTLYPLQDKILDIMASADNQFYLTGGTALSRAYLKHRFSGDLDFFVNSSETYKKQVEEIYKELRNADYEIERADFQDHFSRIFIYDQTADCTVKVDFVNVIAFRVGPVQETSLFIRTDTPRNILSNKITALSRLEAKDIVDIIFISQHLDFHWQTIFNEAKQKDLWVNPIDTAKMLESFSVDKTDDIAWISRPPEKSWIKQCIKTLLADIINGGQNSLYGKSQ